MAQATKQVTKLNSLDWRQLSILKLLWKINDLPTEFRIELASLILSASERSQILKIKELVLGCSSRCLDKEKFIKGLDDLIQDSLNY